MSEIPHKELVELTKEAIVNIIESDPIFRGLPLDPTIDEIKAQIAVAHGQSITLFLERGPLPTLSIVVRNSVDDLNNNLLYFYEIPFTSRFLRKILLCLN